MFRFFYVIFMNLFRAPFMITKMRRYADHPEEHSVEECYELAKRVVDIVKGTGKITTEADGMENLPEEGGYLLYPNHQGKYDALGIIYSHEKPLTFIADDLVSHGILIREFIDLVRGGRIKKRDLKQTLTLFKEYSARVRDGEKCIIFPEGGYYPGKKNQLSEFKPGSFKLAIMSKAPIVPVAIYDSYKPFNSMKFGPVRTYVRYLKPIPYEEYAGKRTFQIADMVRERISTALEEMRKEIA